LLNYDALLRGTLLQESRKTREEQKRFGRIATMVVAMALVILAVAAFGTFLHAHARDVRFDRFISHIKNSEGVLVTDYGKEANGKYFVTALVAGPTSSAALPVEDFGLRRDEVDVKLMNNVFVVDRSNRTEQLQNFLDQVRQLNGIPWPTHGSPKAWLQRTTTA